MLPPKQSEDSWSNSTTVTEPMPRRAAAPRMARDMLEHCDRPAPGHITVQRALYSRDRFCLVLPSIPAWLEPDPGDWASSSDPAAGAVAIAPLVGLCYFDSDERDPVGMPEIGSVLTGKYRLVRLIGEGGMGAVYEAEHVKIGKRVAIKIPHDGIAESASNLERFEREPRAAAATGHRGIVDVHDIGATDEGCPFVVMELLEGESLGARLGREKQIDVPLAIYVVAQVLSALDAAHSKKIIHRDLKPDNVFLVDTGHELPDVKILDFGTCKVLGESQVGEKLTKSGVILGTPLYMAPEQVMEEVEIDHRVDIYAVGALLYKSLTGTTPFVADNLFALVHKVLNNDIEPPSALRADVSASLEEVVLRALARERDDRFGSAASMLQALMPMLDETSKGRVWIPKMLRTLGDSGRASSKPDTDRAPTSSDVASHSAPPSIAAPEGAEDTDSSPTGKRSSNSMTTGLLVAIVVGVAAALGISIYGTDRGDPGTGARVARNDTGPTEVREGRDIGPLRTEGDIRPAPAQKLVTLTIEEVPEGGVILLDRARIHERVMKLQPDAAGRDFVVRVGDEEVLHELIVLDEDLTINVSERIAALTPPDRGGDKRPIRRPGKNGAASKIPHKAPETDSTELPTPPEKRSAGPLDFVRDPDSVQ